MAPLDIHRGYYGGLNAQARDGKRGETLASVFKRAAHIDGPASVLKHEGAEPATMRILGRIAHAEIERKAHKKDALEAPFLAYGVIRRTGPAAL